MPPEDTGTLCALAAMAFVVACVAHEAVGHGGACLASGGTVRVLSSSLFRCTPPRVLVDAAGPAASLITAATAGAVVQLSKGIPRTLFALLLAIAGFWIAGELVASAVTDTDDLAFVLRSLASAHYTTARLMMGVAGAILYLIVMRASGPFLPRGRPLVWAYLATGVVACASTLFYRGALVAALREGALESLGGSVGLLYLAFDPRSRRRIERPHAGVPHSRVAIAISVPVILLFWLTLGRGFVRG